MFDRLLKVFFALVFLFGTTNSVYAVVVQETEPNDTQYMSQLIQRNTQTPQEAAKGVQDNIYVVKGNIDNLTEDWYKVYLNVGRNFLTCNGQYFDYEIQSSSGVVLRSGRYMNPGNPGIGSGIKAFNFMAQNSDYYYVKIKGITSNSTQYFVSVGGPTYALGNREISCAEGTVNMIPGVDPKVIHFDAQNLASLPQDAIVHSITLIGVGPTDVASVRITNDASNLSFSLFYPWVLMKIEDSNMPANSMWTGTLGYSRRRSFTPTLELRYVYPVYDMWVN